jgi:hypothetical protein
MICEKVWAGKASVHVVLKASLKKVRTDPARRKAQDEFFRAEFWNQKVGRAKEYAVTNPLGAGDVLQCRVLAHQVS